MGKWFWGASGIVIAALLGLSPAAAPGKGLDGQGVAGSSAASGTGIRLPLEQCIEKALQNHRSRKVSAAALGIAEAQYQQALSAYWPQLTLRSTATRMDEPPYFTFPGGSLPLGDATGPFAEAIANAQLAKLGITPTSVGVPAFNAALAGATAEVQKNLQSARMPDQKVKLMDRDTLVTSLELLYPLYTGGKRSAAAEQARNALDIAREEGRRTDLQVIGDVTRFYHTAVLAGAMLKAGRDTLERFEVTLDLTESLYQSGGGRVKKTDYLRTRVMVSSLRAFVEQLRANVTLARAALANAVGLDWREEVVPADEEIPLAAGGGELERLVSEAHRYNPQLVQVRFGLAATEARVREARSGHLPVVVLFGNVNRIDNAYDTGLMVQENKNGWTLGLRLELPLFNGFRTTQEEKEMAARVEKLMQEGLLLQEGVALQVKDAVLKLGRAEAQVKTTGEALRAAAENRDLNERAYQADLVETKDVIEAQMMELFIVGQHLKARHDHALGRNDLALIIGRGVDGLPAGPAGRGDGGGR
jgi:outer membrane protein TolC